MAHVYISITGLKLKAIWHAPRFWSLAMPAMAEAQSAPGNLGASARSIDGVHHTLSIWESEAAMRAFLTMPRHLKAMRAFPGIATGKTIGFYADYAPDWPEARRIWEARAREYEAPRARLP